MVDQSRGVPRRIHGLDLIRLFSMAAIVTFHSSETVFYTDVNPLPPDRTVYHLLEAYARWIPFSGFTIVAVSSFLYGGKARGERTWLALLALLTAGVFALAWVNGADGVFSLAFEWDVYSFLLAALLPVYLARNSAAATRALGAAGFALLWLPLWEWFEPPDAPGLAFEALLGFCTRAGGGGWPLLPWSGLIWSFFAWGREWGGSEALRSSLAAGIRRREAFVWCAALALAAPLWGSYLDVPVGPGFGCFMFRKPPAVFWAHFVCVVFLMRASLAEPVNSALASSAAARWVSSLQWSRRFGRCYVLHLLFLGAGSLFADLYVAHPRLFDLYLLSNMPVVEWISRKLERAGA